MAGKGGLSPIAHRVAGVVAEALPDGPLLIALSGGADSAALAWAVVAADRPARAVSVDHGLPGSEALMEAARRIADLLGLEHEVVSISSRSSSETDLRSSRLGALEAERSAGEWILTGHTRDDLAETVLGNMVRGSGTLGLTGIPSVRGPFVRPMLAVTRAEARATATEVELPFVDDPQNDDRSIRRNRLRHETIPTLASQYNPRLVDSLARLAEAAAADEVLLEARARTVPVVERDGAVLVPAAPLQTLPAAVAGRIARRALRSMGDGRAITAADVAAVVEAAHGRRSTIGGNVDVRREGPVVAIVSTAPPVPDERDLDSEVSWGEWRLCIVSEVPVGRFSAWAPDARRLVVRAARGGDRISIGTGSKRVFDAMAEADVPARLRSRWPVVVADGTITWIPGVRSAPVEASIGSVLRAVRRRV